MTQGDVIKLLEKEKRFMTSKEIAEKLDISPGSATANLNKLFNEGTVRRIPEIQDQGMFGRGGKPYKWIIK